MSVQQILLSFGAAASAYSTWNPSDKSGFITLSGGNLIATCTVSTNQAVRGTQSRAAGSDNRYFEVTVTASVSECMIGIGNASANINNPPGSDANGVSWYISGGTGYVYNGGFTGYTAYTVGDVIGIHLNAGTLIYYKNGAAQATAKTGLTGDYYPMVGSGNAGGAPVHTLNVGASAFTASLPSGATAWG